MPKLASEQADTGEETKGAALASQQEVLFVFVKDHVYELSSPNTGLALCVYPCHGKIHCADYSSLPLERGDDVLAFLS